MRPCSPSQAAAIADKTRNLPAEFVRASMSVPYFFQPMTLTEVPDAGSGSELWKQRNGYEGKVPQQVSADQPGISTRCDTRTLLELAYALH